MEKKNFGNLGDSELAALERFRKRRAKLENDLQAAEKVKAAPIPTVTPITPIAQPLEQSKTTLEKENKAAALKNQMVALLNTEIHKLFKAGLDDGKLITLDIQSDSGNVISTENLSPEKLAEMSLSDLNKIRFRVDILNQIIDSSRKIWEKKANLPEILQQANISTSKSYEIVEQASDEKEFFEFFCYVLTQETSTNLMNLFYAFKNYLNKNR